MKRLLKLRNLITIVLLFCSTSWLKIDAGNTSKGVLDFPEKDSVYIAYSDLRTANAKMIELKYIKDINEKLYQIHNNDSVKNITLSKELDKAIDKNRKLVRQRDIIGGAGIMSVILFMISIFK